MISGASVREECVGGAREIERRTAIVRLVRHSHVEACA
jgi:hypothetical protein